MPGIYDLGTEQFLMKDFVDVEGSGEQVTSIIGSISGTPGSGSALVMGANNAELRNLTVENTGAGNSTAFANDQTATSLLHVTAIATGGNNVYAIYKYGGTISKMHSLTLSATGGDTTIGFQCVYGLVDMTDVRVKVSSTVTAIGIHFYSGVVTMNGVDVSVSGNVAQGLYAQWLTPSSLVSNTRIYANGVIQASGVVNGAADPTMRDMVVSVTSSGDNTGINNGGNVNNHKSIEWTNLRITASGGSKNTGISTNNASPTIRGVSATATGGSSSNYGMFIAGSSAQVIMVDNSSFAGDTNSIFKDVGPVQLRIGTSKLTGVINVVGEIACAASYDGSYRALDATCQ